METVIRTKIKDLLKAEPGKEVLAKGWVRTKRGNKNVAFIALNDGSHPMGDFDWLSPARVV